jgi:hypothetical protein
MIWDTYGMGNRNSILGRGRNYSLNHFVKMSYVAHTRSYAVSNRNSLSEVKRPELHLGKKCVKLHSFMTFSVINR